MKKTMLFSGLLIAFFSCEKSNSGTVSTEQVEIAFIKEAELEFLDMENNVIQKIDIEIAANRNKRARGLMDRSQLAKNQGMLFIFDDEEIAAHTFYMKNTRIPLDIMYFDKDSILINTAHNAQPGAEAEINGGTVAGAKSDSKFVVEINGGLAGEWNLKEREVKIHWKTK